MADQEIRIGIAVQSDAAGTSKAQRDLLEIRKRISELKNEFRTGGVDVDTFGKKLSELEKSARKLDSALDAVGEKRRIDIDSGALVDPTQTGAGGGLRRAGRELRNLPSTQVPGLGIGTDAIGNIVRVSGALVDVTEKTKIAAAATSLLTPALGAQAAATYAAYAPIALLVAGFATIGVALKVLTDATSSNAESINAYAANQRKLNEQIADGLTTEEARKELDKLTEAQARNKGTLTTLQEGYDSAQRQLGILGGVVKIFSGDEEALANQINTTNEEIKAQQGQIDALSGALKGSSLTANDLAATIEDLTAKQSRYKDALKAASDQVDVYANQIEDAEKRFAQSNTRSAVDEIMKSIFDSTEATITAAEKAEDATIARQAREDAYYDRLNQIQEEANKKAAETADAITEINSKRDADLLDLQFEYQEQAKKSSEEYHKKRREIEERFEQDRQDAILNNDVLAFEKASKEEEKKALGELRNERKAEKQDIKKQLEEERQKISEAATERITALSTELAQFQANSQAKLDAEKASFEASELALEEREKRTEERANARSARREAYEEALENRREGRALEDHNAAIGRLEAQHLKAESNHAAAMKNYDQAGLGIAKAQEATDKLTSSVQDYLDTTTGMIDKLLAKPNVQQFTPPPIGSTGTAPGALPPPTGFNSPASLNGGAGVTVNHYATYQVGELVTPTELQNTVNQVQNGVSMALQLISGMTGL